MVARQQTVREAQAATAGDPAPAPDVIAAGRVVSLQYALEVGGTLVEAHDVDAPFRYLHGAGNVVPGLEQALQGHRAGDRLSLVVPPELGYGPTHPEFVKRVPRSDFPEDIQPTPGMRFGSAVGERTILPARIMDVGPRDVTVDFNHPLAGATLSFTIQILRVRPATADELLVGRPLPDR